MATGPNGSDARAKRWQARASAAAPEMPPPVFENLLGAALLATSSGSMLATAFLYPWPMDVPLAAGGYFAWGAVVLWRVRPEPGRRGWFAVWMVPFLVRSGLFTFLAAVPLFRPHLFHWRLPFDAFTAAVLFMFVGPLLSAFLASVSKRGLAVILYEVIAPWLVPLVALLALLLLGGHLGGGGGR